MTNTERLKAIASLYQAIGQDDDANAILGMMADNEELKIKLVAITDEYLNAEADAAKLRQQLGDVLAVLNRDGGHYQAANGTELAIEKGLKRYYELVALEIDKPCVVLPKKYSHDMYEYDCGGMRENTDGEWLDVDDMTAAIEAAGVAWRME